MCTSIEDLMRRAQWSGTHGGSRLELLQELQREFLTSFPDVAHRVTLGPNKWSPRTSPLTHILPSHQSSTQNDIQEQSPPSLMLPPAPTRIPPHPSTRRPAAVLPLPQLARAIQPVHGPRLRARALPERHDERTCGARRRGVEYRVERGRAVFGERRLGSECYCLEYRGAFSSCFSLLVG